MGDQQGWVPASTFSLSYCKEKEWANVNEQDRIKIRRKNKGKENTLKN